MSQPDPKILSGVPPSPRETLFRAIDQRLRGDPTLSTLIRPGSFRSWQGRPEDRRPFGAAEANAIRLTPRPHSPEDWWSPDAQTGILFIDVELLVKGFCSDDVDRLWTAVERAVYPTGNQASRFAFVSQLQSLGAHKGLVKFSQPAFDPDPTAGDEGLFRAAGQLAIEYRISYPS